MSRIKFFGIVLTVALLAPVAHADDLTDADELVCAALNVVMCWEDGNCEEGSADELSIPQFIEIDVKRKQLSTTEASGQNRSTPITNLKREEGEIVLQGHEGGRAFSFVISEETGRTSVAIAGNGFTASVFGACTPIASSR